MFVVIEFQTDANGNVSTLTTQHATRAEAESKFYGVLSYAAISEVPLHAALLCRSNGDYIMSQSYKHVQPATVVEETQLETPTE